MQQNSVAQHFTPALMIDDLDDKMLREQISWILPRVGLKGRA